VCIERLGPGLLAVETVVGKALDQDAADRVFGLHVGLGNRRPIGLQRYGEVAAVQALDHPGCGARRIERCLKLPGRHAGPAGHPDASVDTGNAGSRCRNSSRDAGGTGA